MVSFEECIRLNSFQESIKKLRLLYKFGVAWDVSDDADADAPPPLSCPSCDSSTDSAFTSGLHVGDSLSAVSGNGRDALHILLILLPWRQAM